MKSGNKIKSYSRFIRDFFVMDGNSAKNSGKWLLFDYKRGECDFYYFNNFHDAVAYSKKMKIPFFHQIEPIGSFMFLPITLHYKNKKINLLATPDTGANISAFNYLIGEYLDIDYKKSKQVVAYGGTNQWGFRAFEVMVKIEVGFSGHLIKAPVHFLKQKSCPFLLGVSGFFSHYEVVINPCAGIKYRYAGR